MNHLKYQRPSSLPIEGLYNCITDMLSTRSSEGSLYSKPISGVLLFGPPGKRIIDCNDMSVVVVVMVVVIIDEVALLVIIAFSLSIQSYHNYMKMKNNDYEMK